MTFYSRGYPFSFITIWDVLVPDFAVHTDNVDESEKQNKTKQNNNPAFIASVKISWYFVNAYESRYNEF